MKIVQINATYGYGSTGHIVRDIHDYLCKQKIESYVFWATKCTEEGMKDKHIFRIGNTLDHKIHALKRRIQQNQGWNSYIATKILCCKLKKISPDIVHLHNLHSNYINMPVLLNFLASQKILTVITLHDCWFFTGSCMHFVEQGNCQKWISEDCKNCPMFEGVNIKNKISNIYAEKKELFSKIPFLGVIGVSDWILDCGKKSFLKNGVHKRIYNWIDVDVFSPKNNKTEIRLKYNIKENQKIVLGVAQGWSEQKGLREFQLLNDKLGDSAVILLVGEHKELKSKENLRFIGFTNNALELSELYSAADVFVNPSRMETFGKVTAEALSCGTPVVAYNNTGTRELISSGVGVLVEDGNVNELLSAVENVLNTEKQYYMSNCRNSALQRFRKEDRICEIVEFYNDLRKRVQ